MDSSLPFKDKLNTIDEQWIKEYMKTGCNWPPYFASWTNEILIGEIALTPFSPDLETFIRLDILSYDKLLLIWNSAVLSYKNITPLSKAYNYQQQITWVKSQLAKLATLLWANPTFLAYVVYASTQDQPNNPNPIIESNDTLPLDWIAELMSNPLDSENPEYYHKEVQVTEPPLFNNLNEVIAIVNNHITKTDQQTPKYNIEGRTIGITDFISGDKLGGPPIKEYTTDQVIELWLYLKGRLDPHSLYQILQNPNTPLDILTQAKTKIDQDIAHYLINPQFEKGYITILQKALALYPRHPRIQEQIVARIKIEPDVLPEDWYDFLT